LSRAGLAPGQEAADDEKKNHGHEAKYQDYGIKDVDGLGLQTDGKEKSRCRHQRHEPERKRG
jgi:hypothetical protein